MTDKNSLFTTKAIWIKTSGKVEEIKLDHTKQDGSLKHQQELVGGRIETILCRGRYGHPPLKDSETEWYLTGNEEGRLLELPMNLVAIQFVAEMKGINLHQVVSLHGDMILTGCDIDGETVDVPEDIVTMVINMSLFDEGKWTLVDSDGNIDIL